MRFCSFCKTVPVFGTDKKTGLGYCRNHQTMRTDYDKRTIIQKAVAKQGRVSTKVRGLRNDDDAEMGSTQSLMNDLDRIFSLYIRIKYADGNGIVTCFVCDKPYHYLKLDNGHYIKRGNKITRYMEENCYPQCKWCNSIHNENDLPFKDAIERYKPGLTDWLEEQAEQARSVYKIPLDELKRLLITYRDKLKLVQSKLKNN